MSSGVPGDRSCGLSPGKWVVGCRRYLGATTMAVEAGETCPAESVAVAVSEYVLFAALGTLHWHVKPSAGVMSLHVKPEFT